MLDYVVDGWCVWPILRKVVADRITGDFAYSAGKAANVSPLWSQAARDAVALLRLGPARLLIKTYSSGLLEETENGKIRDVWFDDLIIRHPGAVKLEGINNRAFIPARGRALLPSAATTTLTDLTSQFLAGRLKWLPSIDSTSRELCAVINSEFGNMFSETTIRTGLANFFWQRRIWAAILSRVKPETVLLADFGEYGLVAAARERGARVLEMQHGIADRHHPAYAWSTYATSSRRRMPIAERLLMYGDFWKGELSHSDFWSDAVDVVGSSRIDRGRSIARTSGAGPYRLLVTADGIESVNTIRVIRELIQSSQREKLEVVIKLHPVYNALDEEIRAAFAGETRVAVKGASDGASTFQLLRGVDLHASIGSASHYDALGLGTPTAIIGAGNYKTVLQLHESGHAALVFTGRELLDALTRARRARVATEVSDLYFREGAINNILAILGEPL